MYLNQVHTKMIELNKVKVVLMKMHLLLQMDEDIINLLENQNENILSLNSDF